jgi:hypothetical protein
MLEWLSQQSAGQITGLVAVLIGPMIAMVAIVSAAWTRVRRIETQGRIAEAELAVKQEMIERGMSADDIERVLQAGQNSRAEKQQDAEQHVGHSN